MRTGREWDSLGLGGDKEAGGPGGRRANPLGLRASESLPHRYPETPESRPPMSMAWTFALDSAWLSSGMDVPEQCGD